MKIKEGFVLRKVGDSGVVVSLQELDCNHLMTLNESGMALWEMLAEETDLQQLTDKMMQIYDAEESLLKVDIERFLNKVREVGLLDE